jgi:hypothetical protein
MSDERGTLDLLGARLAEAEALARTHSGEIRRAAFAFPPAAPPGESRDQQAAK